MTGLRFFSPWAALSGLMFLAVSPMDLAISRRAWPDSLMSFLASLLVYFGCRILADPKDKKFMILFALIGSYSLLVKESGLILFTLSAVCLLGCLAIQRKNLKPIATLLVFCAVGTEVSIWVLKSLMGEGVSSAWLVLRNVNASIVTNSYAIQNQDGPFYSFFEGLYWISPFTLMLACAGALIILAKRKPEHLWMVFFLASVIFVHTQMKYFKNLRYLSLIYTTYYLMAGAGLCAIADFFRSKTGGQLKRWVIPVCAALVLGFCYLDYKNFEYLFTKIRVQDLVIGPLRDHSIYSIVTTR
jgi:4-amino-4-deoxy-L-arabinose transferase-like glycosyltransferase